MKQKRFKQKGITKQVKKEQDKLDYEILSDCYAKIIDKKNELLELRGNYLNVLEKLTDDLTEASEKLLIENQTLKNNFYIMVITASLLLIGLIIK